MMLRNNDGVMRTCDNVIRNNDSVTRKCDNGIRTTGKIRHQQKVCQAN